MMTRIFQPCLLILLFLAGTNNGFAHGSVTADDDLCVIRIGFYSAHFKVFQPGTSRNREFCEDLPATGESVFVMEYLHAALGEVPIEFRIIRNTTGLGRFTRLADVEAISDLDAVTVFHREPVIEKNVYTVNYNFNGEGDFLGVVRARHPDTQEQYMAVFPFHVGGINWGWLPLIVALAVLAQCLYWFCNGTLRRWYSRLVLPALLLCLPAADLRAQDAAVSDGGHYRVTMQSETEPVPLNRIHTWLLHLETADGEPVSGAELSLSGGMPAHDHGLPTAPQVSSLPAAGDYRVEGLRFHMMGAWELILDIRDGDRVDSATVDFSL